MKSALRLCLCGCVVGLLAAPALADAILEMEVVEINGAPITPSTEVTVNNGDQLTIEYFVRNWTPALAMTYQIRVDGASLSSGPAGSLALAAPHACTTHDDCYAAACDLGAGVCECGVSVFVVEFSTDRADYLFFNKTAIIAPDCTSAAAAAGNYAFGATLLNPNLAVPDPGPGLNYPKYVGTVILEVDDVACGDFTIGVLNDTDQTFMIDSDDANIPMDLSATITVHTPPQCPTTGACCNRATFDCTDDLFEGDCTGEWTADTLCADLAPPCAPRCTVVSADPPGCEVDGRRPHDPNNAAAVEGWNAFAITFNAGCSTGSLTPADFTVTQQPDNTPAPPTVTGVVALGGDAVEVQLSAPINPGKWTCLALTADASQDFCWGYLPADVDASFDSSPSDIIAVIDCINGTAAHSCNTWNADADRSGGIDPSDIIAVIDLLNGASQFQSWFGATLIPARCPG